MSPTTSEERKPSIERRLTLPPVKALEEGSLNISGPAIPREGDMVRARIVVKKENYALADLGNGYLGKLGKSQFTPFGGHGDPSQTIALGDEVDVVIRKVKERIHRGKSEFRVSLSRTDLANPSWEKFEQSHPLNSHTTGEVVEIVRFGAFVRLPSGFRVLLHNSGLSWIHRHAEAKHFLQPGKLVDVVVDHIDNERQRAAVSLRSPWNSPELAERLDQFHPVNSRATGKVEMIMHFGAFVKLPTGYIAFVDNSDLSWTDRDAKASKLLEPGQTVEVVVKRVDSERQRLSASLREAGPNPWDTAVERYPVGSTVLGEVVTKQAYGCFVKLDSGITGLLHKSRQSGLSLDVGDPVFVTIENCDPENHRIGLYIQGEDSVDGRTGEDFLDREDQQPED